MISMVRQSFTAGGVLRFIAIIAMSQAPFFGVARGASFPQPPESPHPDEFGVDMSSGTWFVTDSQMSLGDPAGSGISYVRTNFNGHNYFALPSYTYGPNYMTVTAVDWTIGLKQYKFSASGNVWGSALTDFSATSKLGDGVTLVQTASGFTLTESDGTVITLGSYYVGGNLPAGAPNAI